MFVHTARRWLDSAVAGMSFPYSWLSGDFTDFHAWQGEARSCFLEALGGVPGPVDFCPEILGREDRGGYSATRLAFNVDSVFRTEAYLLMPDGMGPFPAMLALHDHGAFFAWGKEKLVRSPSSAHPVLAAYVDQYYGGRYVADELACRGYAVLSIDQFLWTQQRIPDIPGAAELDMATVDGVLAYNALVPDFERQVAAAMIFAGRTMPGQMLYADRRALDFLSQDPRVDPGRIGCIGLSMGGFRAVQLAAADERVQAAVEIGWMVALDDYLRKHDHLYRYPNVIGLCTPSMGRLLDYPDLVTLACPRPFLLMAGRQDELYPLTGVESAFAKIAAVYASQGVADHADMRWYDVPHCFDARMQDEAFAWLDRWLKGREERQPC